jgi:hypothetical protein
MVVSGPDTGLREFRHAFYVCTLVVAIVQNPVRALYTFQFPRSRCRGKAIAVGCCAWETAGKPEVVASAAEAPVAAIHSGVQCRRRTGRGRNVWRTRGGEILAVIRP